MDDDRALVDALRRGDEAAFAALVRRYQPRLLRLAEATVGSRAVAEEVCQETWMAVVRGIERFEGRSTFKTWLFRILLNRARSGLGREERAGRPHQAVVERFDAAGAWVDPPAPWTDAVEERIDAGRLAHRVHDLLVTLPGQQRQVVVLRDVEGLGPADVSDLMGVSSGNQRVLLHRGRARLRAELAAQMDGGE